MKPFDLEKAKNGAPVCTRDGRPARIICTDAKALRPIIALVTDKEDKGVEHIVSYTKEGKYVYDGMEELDLFIVPELEMGYINVYPVTSPKAGFIWGPDIFNKKEDAKKALIGEGYIVKLTREV